MGRKRKGRSIGSKKRVKKFDRFYKNANPSGEDVGYDWDASGRLPVKKKRKLVHNQRHASIPLKKKIISGKESEEKNTTTSTITTTAFQGVGRRTLKKMKRAKDRVFLDKELEKCFLMQREHHTQKKQKKTSKPQPGSGKKSFENDKDNDKGADKNPEKEAKSFLSDTPVYESIQFGEVAKEPPKKLLEIFKNKQNKRLYKNREDQDKDEELFPQPIKMDMPDTSHLTDIQVQYRMMKQRKKLVY